MTFVSVIVPCYNEEKTITDLLDALYRQSWPRDRMEVVIADGLSWDGTRSKIAEWTARHPDLPVRVVDNARQIIPAGLNTALEAAQGDIIIRMDAHSIPRPDYVARCVDLLEAGRGDNVGGRWDIRPGADTWIARSIALAAGHPLGAGDARYRFSEKAGAVDTVPFGAFRRTWIDKIGGFNEHLETNEDYEFNVRLRRAGGTVWFDPSIRASYIARPTLGDLAAQYFRYGYWKQRMLRLYPASLRTRQALPVLFTLGVLSGPFFWPFPLLRALYFGVLAVYVLILLIAAWRLPQRRDDWRLMVGFFLAVATMHLSWGIGFVSGMLRSVFRLLTRPLSVEKDLMNER